MQVTISVLPVSLNLVHIPRSRLNSLSHPILRHILSPNPSFLNITCNEIELSIFTDEQILRDFEHVARKDRQRQRQRSRSGSGSSTKSLRRDHAFESVEVSYEKWSVLQIDSHSDQLDNSGSRVYDLSAPLAAAGISILYQSSYMSDFIFVKESRLQEVIHLFAQAGFDLYMVESNSSISPSLSPIVDNRAFVEFTSASTHTKGAVFTRTNPAPTCSSHLPSSGNATGANHSISGQQSPRTKSHSPTSGEVRLLDPDLACVGLSDEFGVDHWGLKIVKLVAFPDLIPSNPNTKSYQPSMAPLRSEYAEPSRHTSGTPEDSESSSCSEGEDDGYFSHSPQSASEISFATTPSRSFTNLSSLSHLHSHKSPSKHPFSNVVPLSPISLQNAPFTAAHSHAHHALRSPSPKAEPGVPFFSFTRTPEGSSLTADVHLLATLFPPHERHMVICSGELDSADLHLNNGHPSGDDDSESAKKDRTLKCLQIDLRRFGLDKHGLVNRFSRVLEENNINHMYSSTFKTANVLVDKKDALRAQSLLRTC